MNATTVNNDRNTETHPLDADIERDRTSRNLTLVAYIIASFGISLSVGISLGVIFFDKTILQIITAIIVFGAIMIIAVSKIENLFIIRNDTTSMFLTQNMLRSWLGKDEVNVAYGPGLHICFPWEKRLAQNNISLGEAPNEFEFPIQCSDGIVYAKGSYRMRPDMNNPVAFLTGVAAVADEIKDLIIADAVAYSKGKKVMEVINDLAGLNAELMKFSNNHRGLEDRFGIQIGDTTIRQLLPSEEVQRSLSGLTEAATVQRGTELLLGLSEGGLTQALANGTVTPTDVKDARRIFLSISGNLDGMEIKRSEFDVNITGLDPEAMKALAELVKSPAVQALAASSARKGGGKPSSK